MCCGVNNASYVAYSPASTNNWPPGAPPTTVAYALDERAIPRIDQYSSLADEGPALTVEFTEADVARQRSGRAMVAATCYVLVASTATVQMEVFYNSISQGIVRMETNGGGWVNLSMTIALDLLDAGADLTMSLSSSVNLTLPTAAPKFVVLEW